MQWTCHQISGRQCFSDSCPASRRLLAADTPAKPRLPGEQTAGFDVSGAASGRGISERRPAALPALRLRPEALDAGHERLKRTRLGPALVVSGTKREQRPRVERVAAPGNQHTRVSEQPDVVMQPALYMLASGPQPARWRRSAEEPLPELLEAGRTR